MSTHRLICRLLGASLVAFGVSQAAAQEGPGLGVAVTPADYAPWDISIQPDGQGLPQGSGNAATGAQIYAVKCVACHGVEGAGQPNDRLVGGQGTLTQLAQVRTIGSFWPYASTVFDYVRRAMPFQAPQSLTNDEVYALTAYLLAQNDIIDDDDVMNARTLARVRMPNRDGFILAYPQRADR
ncbi:MAG TPA: cytochrome c [Gammaproteobacteria bacterium]|nr:cytochrome c [Gammaproteobacteria bacterium]